MHKKKLHSLIILIPAFNELNNLRKFIKILSKNYNVLIIDDCSTDQTFSWLKSNKINIKKNKQNIGYEQSIIKGLKTVLKNQKYTYVLTMDADGQHLHSEIKKIFNNKNKDYDIVVGSRSKKNRFIERIISYFFLIFFKINDPLSGFKLYKTNILRKINLNKISNLFLIDLLMEGLINKVKIKNIDVKTVKRVGKPRVGTYISVTFKMLKILAYLLKKKIT